MNFAQRFVFWLGYLWALPNTLVAALFALLTWSKPYKQIGGAVFCDSGKFLSKQFFERFDMGAFTWGGVVISDGHMDWDLEGVAHELTHFKQARIFGPFMVFVYGVASLIAWIRGGNPYSDNALEQWAIKEASEKMRSA